MTGCLACWEKKHRLQWYRKVLQVFICSGKTAFSKIIAQIQLLASIGCKLPATNIEISVADQFLLNARI